MKDKYLAGYYIFYGCRFCGRTMSIHREQTYMPNLECRCMGAPGLDMERLFSKAGLEKENVEILERKQALDNRP